jgi:hypothetical protein
MDSLCQHAFDVFSQLFAQVDFTVIDGFSYISGENSSFTSLNLLKFGKNFLNGAIADDQLQLIFLEMDKDCDGKVDESDWQKYFAEKMVQRANAAAGRASALAFVKQLLDIKRKETLKTQTTPTSEEITETLLDAFEDAVKDGATPRSRTPTGFDFDFISRQQFVLYFSKLIPSPQCEDAKNKAQPLHTPDDASNSRSAALNLEHVFDLFAYLDADGDALIGRVEWMERLGALLTLESQQQQQNRAENQQILQKQLQQHNGSNLVDVIFAPPSTRQGDEDEAQVPHASFTSLYFIDLMLKFFEFNKVTPETAFCFFTGKPNFNPAAQMSKSVFDDACKEYFTSHIADEWQRQAMWSSIVASAALHDEQSSSPDAASQTAQVVDNSERTQFVTGAQWGRIFSRRSSHATSESPPVMSLPDVITKRVTTMLAALLFFNGMTAEQGFVEFADSDNSLLSFDAFKKKVSPLLENVSADELAHWFQHGLGGSPETAVNRSVWSKVMEPCLAGHKERICKEYMLSLAELFRINGADSATKVFNAVLAANRKEIPSQSGEEDALSLDNFLSALLQHMQSHKGDHANGLLQAAGIGGLHMMQSIWCIALMEQPREGLVPKIQLLEAVRTMERAVALLLPQRSSHLLSTLLWLSAINDVPLAQHPAVGHTGESLFDFLCSSAHAAAATARSGDDAASGAELDDMQLSRELFVQIIEQLICAHGFNAADLHTLWLQLFAGESAVTRATWNQRLSCAGIYLPLDVQACSEQGIQNPDVPKDRLITLLEQMLKHCDAPIVCQAVQFECRSNPDGSRGLLNEAYSHAHYGCITLDGLSKVLDRCVQKYRDGACEKGGAFENGGNSPLLNVSQVAEEFWKIAWQASASSSVAAAVTPPLLPPIIIDAVFEAIRKHTHKLPSENGHNREDNVSTGAHSRSTSAACDAFSPVVNAADRDCIGAAADERASGNASVEESPAVQHVAPPNPSNAHLVAQGDSSHHAFATRPQVAHEDMSHNNQQQQHQQQQQQQQQQHQQLQSEVEDLDKLKVMLYTRVCVTYPCI